MQLALFTVCIIFFVLTWKNVKKRAVINPFNYTNTEVYGKSRCDKARTTIIVANLTTLILSSSLPYYYLARVLILAHQVVGNIVGIISLFFFFAVFHLYRKKKKKKKKVTISKNCENCESCQLLNESHIHYYLNI